MHDTKRHELEELKKFLVDIGWVDGLFQILFLLEDTKVGVWLQSERKELKQLRNMLYWFNLYVSMRHGGYATKNKALYKEWNKIFGFELDAVKFLGYLACCVKIHKLGLGSNVIGVHLYSLIKEIRFGRKPKRALTQFLTNIRFLHHYPHKSSCVESINLERRFESVIAKYHWLVGDLLAGFDKQKIGSLIQVLEFLPSQLPHTYLGNTTLLLELELNPDDLREILANGREFKDNLEYSKGILSSFM